MQRWFSLDALGALVLALAWVSPLAYAAWAAFHDVQAVVGLDLSAPWTLANFRAVWQQAPWLAYIANTIKLVTTVLIGQLVLCTLAGFAFARFEFPGRGVVFILVLMQLFILPEVLIVENYATIARIGLFDTTLGIGLPYMASAFGIFLLRQAFKSVPKELEEAARPVYLAYALVSVATHWNNFLWPLIVTNSPQTRPLTVGLSLFGAPESGVDISLISAATLMTIAPLVLAFIIFQRQFMQAFLTSGIK
jgi:sn-glycerol 3-phosphate transport system permease protein